MIKSSNKIYLVSTPIGNLDDITLRAIKILKQVDKIVCEDTRVSKKLLNFLGIKKELISYNKFNEKNKLDSLMKIVTQEDIAIISDAGTPLIADPGYLLVKECIKMGIQVVPIPGCSSIIAALSASGIPSNNFVFLGFLEKSSKVKQQVFKEYYKKGLTIVFFESPNRVLSTLQDIKEVFGKDQKVVIAREITKIYEQFISKTVVELQQYFESNIPKGEFVIMIYVEENKQHDLQQVLESKLELIKTSNTNLIAKEISNRFGFNKKEVYEEIIKLKK